MIAFQPNMPVGYAVGPTMLSILIAMLISGLGLAVSMMRRIGMPLLGGAIIGAGIGAMHFVGMSALRGARHRRVRRDLCRGRSC